MKSRIVVSLLFIILASGLEALDITIEQTFSNNYLSPTRDSDDGSFTGEDYFLGLDVHFKEGVSEGLYFNGGYETSKIQRNRVFSLITFDNQLLEVSFGPYMGILNTEKYFNSGLIAKVGFLMPGLFFLKTGFDTSFAPITKVGDYYTNNVFLSAGLFIPNGIITLKTSYDQGLFKYSDFLVEDSLSSYYMNTEVFVKNFPFRFNLNFEYQIYSKIFDPGYYLELHSFMTGLKTVWEITPDFQVFVTGKGSVFSFGLRDLDKSGDSGKNLFQFSVGLSVSYQTDKGSFEWSPPTNLSTEDLGAEQPPSDSTDTEETPEPSFDDEQPAEE